MTQSTDDLRNTLRKRARLLSAIIESPREKSELAKELNISRSTINRGIRSYENNGCLEYKDGKYHATPFGEHTLNSHNKYIETVECLSNISELINSLPKGVNISDEFVTGVNKHLVNPQIPRMAVQTCVNLLKNSNKLLSIFPMYLPMYIQEIKKSVENNNLNADIIMESDMLRTLIEAENSDIEFLKSSDKVKFYMTDESIPYVLWISESDNGRQTQMIICENKTVQGVLSNDREGAVEWACEQYNKNFEQATELQ